MVATNTTDDTTIKPKTSKLCLLWQKRLRLQDWMVTVKIVPSAGMAGFCGLIERDYSELSAVIKISDKAPLESTLVHELLHLRMHPFGDDDTEEKQAVMNLLADSFMRAYKNERRETHE